MSTAADFVNMPRSTKPKRRPTVVGKGAPELWHISRDIPVALLFAFLCQCTTVVWWGRGIDDRTTHLEYAVTSIAPQADRLTRLEERLRSIETGVQDLKVLLAPTRGTKR